MTKNTEVKEQGYDEMPYSSYPFDYNRPENLNAISRMFGVNSPSIEKARILEMGGADGTNLLKFAIDYPQAKIVGIDLSEKQVAMGQKRIKEMGLKNYELKHMSITDLDESMGKFDYIICHGVYAWVPDFVKESILSNCNKLLSDNGIAFVSYNTLPGWNMNNTVRDLMMFHSRNFDKVEDKVAQARLALDFVCDSLKNADTPYSKFLQKSAADLKLKEDHYLRHEFLADENDPCYFHEFVEAARKQGLEYVGDTDYQRMNIANMPPKAAELLSQIKDIVRTEQYADFIMNSQFRCSMLCKQGVKIDRNITPERLSQFSFTSNMVSEEKYSDKDVLNDQLMSFHKKGEPGMKVSSASPEQKAILATMIESKSPLSYDEIINSTQSKFKTLKKESIKQILDASLGQLIFSRHVEFYTYPPKYMEKISDKPKIHDVDLYRYKNKIPSPVCWVTTGTNKLFALDSTFVHFLEFFDGNHTAQQITEEIHKLIQNGALNLEQDGKKVTDAKLMKQGAEDLYKFASNLLLENNLLVA